MDKYEKELKELKESSEAKQHLESLRATFKKIPNWKMPGQDGIQGF